jgi:orotidine-5'-phosphate decarboxylase
MISSIQRFANEHIPLLIPGVGGQGGSAQDVAQILLEADYDLRLARINSSSGLTHPWIKQKEPIPDERSFAKRCIDEIIKLNETIENTCN